MGGAGGARSDYGTVLCGVVMVCVCVGVCLYECVFVRVPTIFVLYMYVIA